VAGAPGAGGAGGVVVRLAPAKLNLTLAVVGRRPDGFHDLHSVMVPLELADRLALAPAFGPADTLHVTMPDGRSAADLGPPERNLVLRAIAAARQTLRQRGAEAPLPALAVRLEKRIPVAAGLAGGSSDAAAAINGSFEAWGIKLADEGLADADVAAAGAAVGSDVPFFFAGGWALVEGRGERVTPLRAPTGTPPGVLLVTPALAVPTPDVFRAYASGARPTGRAALATSQHLAGELAAGLSAARLAERAGLLAVANDLVPATAALLPELVTFRRRLGRLLGRSVGQSGSGPTLWVLYPSAGAAAEAKTAVDAAVADGSLVAPGGAPPLVIATSILPSTRPAVAGTPPPGGDAS
jgi:4-diphosphocytidyl-2-C-methyl-D-erythritol kinase